MKRSSIVANFVIGTDGSYSPSRELTVPEDRARFHQIREQAALILVGGNTAREEPYATINQELLVITRQSLSQFDLKLIENEKVRFFINQEQYSVPEIAALESEKLWRQYQGGKYLLVEGGPSIIAELISACLLDTLFLTRSPKIASGARLTADGIERMLSSATLIDQYFIEVENSGSEAIFEEYEYWRGEGI
jgi:riboflavin biosynthesis pyrimidine reductase